MSSICYFENWLTYHESPIYALEIDEDLDIRLVHPEYVQFTEAYYYFTGERPDDYGLIHFDWFFSNFWQIAYYAEKSVHMLANKGHFDPYYYTFDNQEDPDFLLGVSRGKMMSIKGVY